MTNRLKKIGGKLAENSFAKLLKQIEGRGVLAVLVINRTCPECDKLQLFVSNLEQGAIQKAPNLVLFYGYSSIPIEQGEAVAKAAEKRKERAAANPEETEQNNSLSDTTVLDWETIPEGHGYALFTRPDEKIVFRGDFDHDAFHTTVLDTLRRFRTSIRTLPNLAAKRRFIEQQGTGILVETHGATPQSKISAVEAEIAPYMAKLKMPVYFLRSITQEISYYQNGQLLAKVKGLNFQKLLKKIPG